MSDHQRRPSARTRPQRLADARDQAYRAGYADGLRAVDPAYAREVA